MTDRSETKYGDRIADHEWRDPEPEPDPPRTRVKSHELDVYYDTVPDPDDNYERDRYTVRLDHRGDEPEVLVVVKHRWKGNYWRDTTDLDFRDAPEPVRRRVAAALPVDSPATLDPDERLVDEGGESRFAKYHRPRMESLSGGQMWALSFLDDALKGLDNAHEALEDGTRSETLVGRLVETTRRVRAVVEDEEVVSDA